MSIGPIPKPQKDTIERPFMTTGRRVSQVVKAISDEPAPRIFWFGVALLVIGLPFGVNFPPTYYGVLFLVGMYLALKPVKAEPEAEKKVAKQKRDHAKH